MKKITILLTFFATLILLPSAVFADVKCHTQYGGGEICVRTGEVQIDKKVWSHSEGLWVDNIGSAHSFKVGQEVLFKLKIKNVGDETLHNVRVTDNLPEYLTHVSGDLNFIITNLNPGQTHERDIRTKVVSKLPVNQGLICDNRTTNVANVSADGGSSDRDSAQICVDHRVLGKGKGIPKTGPEQFLLLGLGAIGAAGFYLKKLKSS